MFSDKICKHQGLIVGNGKHKLAVWRCTCFYHVSNPIKLTVKFALNLFIYHEVTSQFRKFNYTCSLYKTTNVFGKDQNQLIDPI